MVDVSETEVELNIDEEAKEDYEVEDGMAAPVCLYVPKFAYKFWLHKACLMSKKFPTIRDIFWQRARHMSKNFATIREFFWQSCFMSKNFATIREIFWQSCFMSKNFATIREIF